MKVKNPIVVASLVGLTIIIGVAAYTFLKPEPEPAVHSATYGYYHQESRVGELQLTLTGTRTYQFEGDFGVNTTVGEIGGSFNGDAEYTRDWTPAWSSFSQSYKDSSLPLPTAVDAGILVDLTIDTTFLLLPERWAGIHAGYSTQFAPSIPSSGATELDLEMTAVGTQGVVVPSGSFGNCFVVNGTRPDMELEMTIWVASRDIVPQAEITMPVRGVGPLILTLKLEHYQ